MMVGSPVVFDGCGGLYSYMLGITAELQQRHDLSGTRFLTASGGSVSGLLLAAGIDAERFHLDCNRSMLEDCRAHATGFLFNIRVSADRHLREFLPPAAFEMCTERLLISLTTLPGLRNEVVSSYRSNEELVDCMMATMFWPLAFDGRWSAIFNGRRYWDGALTLNRAAIDNGALFFSAMLWRRMPWHWRIPWADPVWHDRLFYLGAFDARQHLSAHIANCYERRRKCFKVPVGDYGACLTT
jgi:Patatin-like phospholipase